MRKIAMLAGTLTLLLVAVGFTSATVATAPAYADDACVQVSIDGSITGPHAVDECVPTPRQVLCVHRWASVQPFISADARVCVPIPGQLPVVSGESAL